LGCCARAGLRLWEIPKRRVNLPLGKIKVFELPSQVVLVGGEIKEAVAAVEVRILPCPSESPR
jgi:hypothetical protein